ncbi:MAG: 50S ribosomal protein L22 [candidate division Zixibacteria bacterium]|nr:50S ribosomal protein L22 [candidate division Zixibacteria bacterium]
MEYKAKLRFLKISARKVRQVADLVRGQDVEKALETLYYVPKAASDPLMKTIKSATSNAINSEGSAKVKAEDLFIKELRIDGGPVMKRIRPAPMGRAYRIRKRTSHIDLIIAVKSDKLKAIQAEEAKAKAKSKKS